jgi:hypothetical protein
MMKKGMNPEAVRQMGTQIGDSGQDVRTAYTTVQGRVTDFDWTGEDRDRYVSEFEGTLGGLVDAVVQQLTEFGERASANADQQESASA